MKTSDDVDITPTSYRRGTNNLTAIGILFVMGFVIVNSITALIVRSIEHLK